MFAVVFFFFLRQRTAYEFLSVLLGRGIFIRARGETFFNKKKKKRIVVEEAFGQTEIKKATLLTVPPAPVPHLPLRPPHTFKKEWDAIHRKKKTIRIMCDESMQRNTRKLNRITRVDKK